MTRDKRLTFHIDAYSPETIPMAKLAEYMSDFALLLGREHAVHFDELKGGSTQIAARVEVQDVPKVRDRLADIRGGNVTKETLRLFEQIDERLANDNATGLIYADEPDGPQDNLLIFPGRDRPKALAYGPFNQDGHLDGILISIGGKDETAHLRLQNGETVFANCQTSRVLAREIAKHLFEPVRIHGTGRWMREASETWTLRSFRVQRFERLDSRPLREVIDELRTIKGSDWRSFDDPLAELANMRREDDGMH